MSVQRLPKPSLVDFLRLCDRRRWCSPRIRYASIRSKRELCEDLLKKFRFVEEDSIIRIVPLQTIRGFPKTCHYDTKARAFFLDGKQYDMARASRKKPTFRLEHKTVELVFGPVYGSGTAVAVASMFP